MRTGINKGNAIIKMTHSMIASCCFGVMSLYRLYPALALVRLTESADETHYGCAKGKDCRHHRCDKRRR